MVPALNLNGILQHWLEVVFLWHDAVTGDTKKAKMKIFEMLMISY